MKPEMFEHVKQYFMKQDIRIEMNTMVTSFEQDPEIVEVPESDEEAWICMAHGEGCLAAIRMAQRYPNKVKALITISLNLQPYSALQHSMLKILARKDVKIGSGLLPYERSSKQELMPYYHTLSITPSKLLLLSRMRKEVSQIANQVQQPWLFLYGDHELPPVTKTLQQLKTQVPQLQYAMMPHCGHYSPLEDPKGLAKQVHKFLNELYAVH